MLLRGGRRAYPGPLGKRHLERIKAAPAGEQFEHFFQNTAASMRNSKASERPLHARKVAIATIFTEGFSAFVTSTTALIANGRTQPAPGQDLHPL